MGKSEQNLSINGLTNKQFLVIAFEAIKYLGWRIRFISDAGVIAYTQNSEYSWNGELTVKLGQDTANIQCVSISGGINDFGQSERAVSQYISAFEKLTTAFTDDEIRQKYKIYKKDFLPPYEDTLKPDITPKYNFSGGFLSYFKPRAGYCVTPILIDLNILIFLVMVCTGVSVFQPDGKSMIGWGANATIYTLDGQWWRLISNCFIHFGVIHLLMNMYALFFVGLLLEPFLGKAKFITAYLLTGILASLASLWWHDNTVSAGASGAIFGMYGVFLALLSTNHIERSMRNGLLANIGVFVVYNLVYGSFKGGIDNAAHLGGLLSGVLIGYAFMPALQKPDSTRIKKIILVSVSVVAIICSVVIYDLLSTSDRLTYQKRIVEFYNLESTALNELKESGDKSEQMLRLSLQKGMDCWKRSINLITELDHLKLSEKLHKRNKILIHYCQLRLQSYQLISQNINLDAGIDMPQVQQINKQIKSTIDELSSQ
ncbi:rhomboid family intramembrane serine protease [Pedobacter sp. MC2016-24]|uniref:rhomboid family intramembrane serine protease n=1 Tax=Pedobacter sp. MC2016-24 TaxID=2780090 RepID=UPI0018802666|nr:rhomboid family intramembrane serine protease [Pedobacter sp. MC2016-24]MBE9597792.1 rhomboid family intramembrane serine protease [Pedobacter sp. MC2016-24]